MCICVYRSLAFPVLSSRGAVLPLASVPSPSFLPPWQTLWAPSGLAGVESAGSLEGNRLQPAPPCPFPKCLLCPQGEWGARLGSEESLVRWCSRL